VRELENTLHRAVLLSQSDVIGPEAIVLPDGAGLSDIVRTASVAAQAAQMADSISRSLVGRTVADVERDLILETLDHVLGNRTHAANILGISIRTLRNKLNQYADEGTSVPAPGEMRKSA
jgi:DNA-binding NtrC family response regulator